MKVYVPANWKNNAMQLVAGFAGLGTLAKLVQKLNDHKIPFVTKEDHEVAPAGHEHISHT